MDGAYQSNSAEQSLCICVMNVEFPDLQLVGELMMLLLGKGRAGLLLARKPESHRSREGQTGSETVLNIADEQDRNSSALA